MVLCVLTACGRIAFDPIGDASVDTPDAPAACTSFGPWRAPVSVAEINTSSGDADPYLSQDGLRLFWTRYDAIGEAWSATRSSPTAPWTNVAQLDDLPTTGNSEGNLAFASDELEVYYGVMNVLRRTRTSAAVVFSNEESVFQTTAYSGPEAVSLTGDGLDAYFGATKAGDSFRSIYRVHRAVKTDAFVADDAVAISSGGDVAYPGISRDGLELVYSKRDPGDYNLFSVTRASTSVEFDFATATRLDALDSTFDDQDPEMTPDRTQIFFSTLRASGAGSYDVFTSSRDCVN